MSVDTSASDRELVLTRLIDAPREKLFRAWTEPEVLKQWFTPVPYTTPVAELDVRPGGANLIVMRDPEGNEFPNRGVYLEVVENERLVFTDAYTEAWQPSQKPFMTVIVTFENEDGKTRYTARVRHWTVADREAHEKMGFHDGWGRGNRSTRSRCRKTLILECTARLVWRRNVPIARGGGTTMAKGVLIAAMDFSSVAADEFNDWYDSEHIPERQRVPGFLTLQRWIGAENPRQSVATYDLDNLAVLQSPGYRAIGGENLSPWSKRVTSKVERLLRYEGEQILPGDATAPTKPVGSCWSG
jgi:uncharacterized protein YndB with AHSA1/START domain